jgi:AraC-like DNA-binding protein
MLSHDHSRSPSSQPNPFHFHLLSGLDGLTAAPPRQHRPPIPFQSPENKNHSDRHAVFQLSLPDVDLIALEGPSCREQLQQNRSTAVIFVAEGEVCIEQKDASWCGSSGECLIVQGDRLHWSSTDFSIVCLMFPEQQQDLRIQQLHRQLPLPPVPPPVACLPACCQSKDGKDVASLIRALHLLLCIISDLHTSCPLLLPHLRMGDQLGTLTAMLALPELRQASTGLATNHASIKNHSILANLLDYIDSHLADHLSLDVLEVQSHYSRRTLQYAFRAQYGCTVTQWIRSRRLDLAHRRLSLGAAGDTVGDIARACGYHSMSLFSIEFQQRFHIKPSVLLREARVSKTGGLTNQAPTHTTDDDETISPSSTS